MSYSAFYQLHVKEEESSRLKYVGYVCFGVFVLTGEPKEVYYQMALILYI